jgi:hypothetical protein
MTSCIRPGSDPESAGWARFGFADDLQNSKGEKKLRADLTSLFGNKVNEVEKLDTAHHLSVALQDDKIYEKEESGVGGKHFQAGWRGVAVKIGTETASSALKSVRDDVANYRRIKSTLESIDENIGLLKQFGPGEYAERIPAKERRRLELIQELNCLDASLKEALSDEEYQNFVNKNEFNGDRTEPALKTIKSNIEHYKKVKEKCGSIDENIRLLQELKYDISERIELQEVLNSELRAIAGELKKGLNAEEYSKLERGEEIEFEEPVPVKNQYIILNINSLANRLGVTKKQLRDHEKEGTVDVLIRSSLQELAYQQESMTKIINTLEASITSRQAYAFSDTDRAFFKKFASELLGESKKNNELIDKFFEDVNDRLKLNEAGEFLTHLHSKIWWDDSKTSFHEKVALRESSLKDFPAKFYHGEALNRSGHLGKAMNRFQFLPWDTANRYAIAVGDYVYSVKPRHCPKNMVSMELKPDRWILVNVHSLSRLGLDEKTVRKKADSLELLDAINEKVDILNQFNESFQQDFPLDNQNENWITNHNIAECLEDYCVTHPDDEVRALSRETADLIRKDFNNIDPYLNEFKVRLQGFKIPTQKKEKSVRVEKGINPSYFAFSLLPRLEKESPFSYRLGTISLEGFKVFIGTAKEISGRFPHPGHAGNEMQRVSFFSWDKENRYALACSERIYKVKPAYHPSKVVPVKFVNELVGSGWLLVNVHSLGRLGLNKEMVAEALERGDLDKKISDKLKYIHDFNEKYLKLIKEADLDKFSETFMGMGIEALAHPGPDAQKILLEAAVGWDKMDLAKKQENFDVFKKDLRVLLVGAHLLESEVS